MKKNNTKTPTPDDHYIGDRIREARNAANMSQGDLGQLLGISFQQVQKYERGYNRVSGARIKQLVSALNRPLTFFLPDVTDVRAQADPMLSKFLASHEGLEIATKFFRLSPAWQGFVLKLVKLAAETAP